jgi:DNA-binding transcriptional regulator LsrR (DeoR family)
MDISHHYLLAQIASMYYEQELTQNEIGERLGLSRVKVYRLLKQAKESRVVQIKVTWPVERHVALEQAFKETFGLKDALVLKSAISNGAPLLSQIGQLGAQYLERILEDGMTLALCLGSSTFEVINAISADFQARIRVAQATGSLPFAVRELDSAAMARQLAEKLGGEVLYLSSPLLADSVEDAGVLRNQREIRRTLDAAGQAEVALLGIGSLDPQKSGLVKSGFITPETITTLIAAGAVGDMAGQIFTLPGELHPCPYNQRVIGITFDDLCRVPTVIAVAAGREKATAILGALRTCVIKVFCTDESLPEMS